MDFGNGYATEPPKRSQVWTRNLYTKMPKTSTKMFLTILSVLPCNLSLWPPTRSSKTPPFSESIFKSFYILFIMPRGIVWESLASKDFVTMWPTPLMELPAAHQPMLQGPPLLPKGLPFAQLVGSYNKLGVGYNKLE